MSSSVRAAVVSWTLLVVLVACSRFGDDNVPAPLAPGGPRSDAGLPEVCGDGIDQDMDGVDPPCPPNDSAAGAIDVTAGGTFTSDVRFSHTAPANGCGEAGGRAAYFKLSPTAALVYYFDTFGSDFDTVVRYYDVPCAQVPATGANLRCSDDACSLPQSQLAVRVPAGESCLVVAQRRPEETRGNVALAVVAAAHDAAELPPRVGGDVSVSENTCKGTSSVDILKPGGCGGCGAASNSHCRHPTAEYAYFFTTCPGNTAVTGSTCQNNVAFDTVAVFENAAGELLACDVDHAPGACNGSDSFVQHTFSTKGLWFVGVAWSGNLDLGSSACGGFSLKVSFTKPP